MINYSITEISSIINSDSSIVFPQLSINKFAFDSRRITVPDGVLFFCINSSKDNGHNYINQLIDLGVKSFVVSESVSDDLQKKANFLFVSSAINALQQFAIYYRESFKNPVIAITGSNGKTIVKEWLSTLISSSYSVFRSPKSYNSQLGVPMSVCLADNNCDFFVLEAGISKVGEMQNLQRILKPDYGVFTNIGSAHQKYFSNYREKIHEKLKLFESVKSLIYQNDDSLLSKEIIDFAKDHEVILFSWSLTNSDSDILIDKLEKKKGKTNISFIYKSTKRSFSIPFTDDASIENVLHCLAMIHVLGFDINFYLDQFMLLKPIAMRMELKAGINDCIVINDSYNSDINSLEISLDFLHQQKKSLKRTVILSDIEQVQLYGKELYNRVAHILEKYKVDRLIAIGKNISNYSTLFSCQTIIYDSTSSFLASHPIGQFKSEAILIKGARNFEFEKISHRLEKITHQTCLEVNLTALTDNLNYFKSKLEKETKVMAMVKAFSYGSGSSELVNMLQYNKVDYLAVAFVDEGIDLRKGGVHLPIMVMNPEPSGFDAIVEYELEPEIFNISGLKRLIEVAKSHGVSSVPVHIKLDTGMHRLGFEDYNIEELTDFLHSNPQILIKSVFTHLVGSEDSNLDPFTQKQVERFNTFVDKIRLATGQNFLCHVLNSAGIARFPEYQFDMVRLGIGLYGGIKVENKNLRVVSTLKTYISQIRIVDEDETIGYSRKGKLARKSKIATLPIGYADGLNRKFGNGNLSVLVHNKFAPIVGNICMDMCMIDVTDIEVSEGDLVTVFGDKPTIFELAQKIETIPYEILTSISSRVNRLYFSE